MYISLVEFICSLARRSHCVRLLLWIYRIIVFWIIWIIHCFDWQWLTSARLSVARAAITGKGIRSQQHRKSHSTCFFLSTTKTCARNGLKPIRAKISHLRRILRSVRCISIRQISPVLVQTTTLHARTRSCRLILVNCPDVIWNPVRFHRFFRMLLATLQH